jgi:hypothetical protein
VDTDSDTHEHVLWRLDKLTVDALKITLLKRLETKVSKFKIPISIDDTLHLLCNLHNLIGDDISLVKLSHREMEVVGTHFVDIARYDARGQDFIIGIRCDHTNTYLSGECINFLCGDVIVHRRKHLLCNLRRVTLL